MLQKVRSKTTKRKNISINMLNCSGHWRWKDLWKTQNASSVGGKWLSTLLAVPGFNIGAILLLGIQVRVSVRCKHVTERWPLSFWLKPRAWREFTMKRNTFELIFHSQLVSEQFSCSFPTPPFCPPLPQGCCLRTELPAVTLNYLPLGFQVRGWILL